MNNTSTQKGKPVQTHRIRLQGAHIQPHAEQPFHILAITSGSGNGWNFSAEVLQKSLPCWQNLPCYVDHSPLPGLPRSVRDLAGVCRSPAWDEGSSGVRLQLVPGGPSAGLLRQVGEEMLQEKSPLPGVGFSADVLFRPNGRQVEQILKVNSVDLVMEPARGGRFIKKVTLTKGKGERMDETKMIEETLDKAIRPSLKMDGGDVELVDVGADGVVKVKLTGACGGCRENQTACSSGCSLSPRITAAARSTACTGFT